MCNFGSTYWEIQSPIDSTRHSVTLFHVRHNRMSSPLQPCFDLYGSPGITKDCHSYSPQLIPPFLRIMTVPRFSRTQRLERFQRQFYQWWHIDCMTQSELWRNFNVLFEFLFEYEGEKYEVRKALSYLGIVLIIANNSPIQL